MSGFVVWGAGGRAGRRAVAEARARGHEVTAVVRDPAAHADAFADDAPGDGGGRAGSVRLVAGDATDAARVAELTAGADVVISAAAVYGPGTDPDAFFTASSRALLAGVRAGGVRRLLVVGLASLLPGPEGRPLLETMGLPQEFMPFVLAHRKGLDVLRQEGADVDWLYASPAGDFDHDGVRTGRYGIAAHGDPADRISYQDFAVALLDEAERPRHRHTHLAVTG
ncbi:NAD(P)-dependent oxidoreductase [Streptomyces avicenniae]|uniref:NAD(P)-dependent oxidoreductase n=1 Tax=Streptomyces avicenniae TaxID=500153 RepID=UPI00069BDE96|nr:NAD(P)H-binding protein [Streptomyces avicenniae]